MKRLSFYPKCLVQDGTMCHLARYKDKTIVFNGQEYFREFLPHLFVTFLSLFGGWGLAPLDAKVLRR